MFQVGVFPSVSWYAMNLLKFIFTLSRTHSWSVLYCPLPSFRICKTKRIHGLLMEKFLLLDHLKFTVILHIGVLSRNATCGLWELQGVHMCTYAALAIISASQFTIIHCCLKLDYWHIIVPKNLRPTLLWLFVWTTLYIQPNEAPSGIYFVSTMLSP